MRLVDALRLPVRLNARGAEWIFASPVAADGPVAVKLCLGSKCPKPLALAGRVIASDARPEGHTIRAVIAGLSESVQGSLEKFIFRIIAAPSRMRARPARLIDIRSFSP